MDNLKVLLDNKVAQYNQRDFIPLDPISIPHQFSKKQDIEIMGLWAAVLAWGQRVTILKKSNQLIDLMDGAPHDFIMSHEEKDLERFRDFKHRTFMPTDSLYFILFFRWYYQQNDSLEDAFANYHSPAAKNVEKALIGFHEFFFSLQDVPHRTKKHIATPARNSSCKRLNMFLRWMVRKDDKGVDFGIWDKIKMSQLVCPLDVHVGRISRKLGLLARKQTDWRAALELTERLKAFNAEDPVKYDIALFGMGIEQKGNL